MEDWRLNATYSGTPQGGILSPILANIYLHELDMKVEAMQKAFAKGHDRAYSAAYSAANSVLKRKEIQLPRSTDGGRKAENPEGHPPHQGCPKKTAIY